jgi:hypothetical protein
MREPLGLIRFFLVVPPVSRLMVWTFLVMAVLGAAVLVSDPAQGSRVLLPVLLLQLFAASSGFGSPARRGHYDLLLTSGHRRIRVALAHWAMSVAPGVVSWLALGAVEVLASAGARATLMSAGTASAMFLVSSLAWSVTIAMPRFAAGIGWLMLLMTAASMSSGGEPDAWLAGGMAAERSAASVLTVLIFPPVLLGRALSASELAVALPPLACGALAVGLACAWVGRAEFPLEAAQ